MGSPLRFAFLMLTAILAGCGLEPTGPAGQPSITNVNPETGSRGGSGSTN